MQGVQGGGGTPRQKKEQGQRHCDSMGQGVFRKVQVFFLWDEKLERVQDIR